MKIKTKIIVGLNLILILSYFIHLIFSLDFIFIFINEYRTIYLIAYYMLGLIGLELMLFNIYYFIKLIKTNNKIFVLIYLNFLVIIFWIILFFY
ncbi:MAG: hypothetical protein A2X64_07445 [Ignavibacteria bacterium GWF2_33_9]|nr:MAG: hypothetical protein A2X64_07445 [Ignavibacteria bacterium GWF2_33_9]